VRRRDLVLLAGGAALAWSPAAHTQQKAMPVIAYLGVNPPDPFVPFANAFRQGLSETGYVDGQNVAIEYRWAEGHYDRLPGLAAELVRRNVDLIAAGSLPAAQAAKSATRTIPIVLVSGGDPVALGLIASLARPGGNLTGVSVMSTELSPKRLELLSELAPLVRVVVLLVNPNNANTEGNIGELEEAARAKGMQLPVLKASTEDEIAAAFSSLVPLHADALLVVNDPFFISRRNKIVALASQHTVPAIYGFREFVEAGGLISYGTSLVGIWRQLGAYAGRILNGAKPADLPVQQPTKFELVINLKTAAALGLTVPQALLARADEVIE